MEDETANRQYIVQELQKEFGNHNVIGRIKDLVKVNDDVIDFWCCRMIDEHGLKIVVDGLATALLCLEFLRVKKLGVETILTLQVARDDTLKESYSFLGADRRITLEMLKSTFSFDPIMEPVVVWMTNNTLGKIDLEEMGIEGDHGIFYSEDGLCFDDGAIYYDEEESSDGHQTTSEDDDQTDQVPVVSSLCEQKSQEYDDLEIELKYITESLAKLRIDGDENIKADYMPYFPMVTRMPSKESEAFRLVFDHVYAGIGSTYEVLMKSLDHVINNTADPSVAGALCSVMPEGRSHSDYQNMSAEEQTMVTLALVLALWKYKRSPFIYFENWNISKVTQYLNSVSYKTVKAVTEALFDISTQILGNTARQNFPQAWRSSKLVGKLQSALLELPSSSQVGTCGTSRYIPSAIKTIEEGDEIDDVLEDTDSGESEYQDADDDRREDDEGHEDHDEGIEDYDEGHGSGAEEGDEVDSNEEEHGHLRAHL